MSDTVQELPQLVATGATNQGTTAAVTYALPTGYQVDDILVLSVETASTAGPVLSSATITNGWQTALIRVQGSNVLSLGVFWKRATSTSETAPVVAAQANHQVGFTSAFRQCVRTGTPFETPPSESSNNSTSASLAMNAIGTTLTMTAAFFASSTDATADQFGSVTNGSLSNVTKQKQAGTTNGNGGSVNLITGTRNTAGSGGTFAATHAASAPWACIGLTFKSHVPIVTPTAGTFQVLVGGVKKNAVAYVIVGGVKKPVVSTCTIVGGAKRLVP